MTTITEINEKTLKVIEEYIFHFLNQLDSNNSIFDKIINDKEIQFMFQYHLFHQVNTGDLDRPKFKVFIDFNNYVKNIDNNFYTYIKNYNNEFYEYINVKNNYIEIIQYIIILLDIKKLSDSEYIINEYVSRLICSFEVNMDEILKGYEKGYEKNILK
jgi:hypothetical protein